MPICRRPDLRVVRLKTTNDQRPTTIILLLLILLALGGCGEGGTGPIVVFCSPDSPRMRQAIQGLEAGLGLVTCAVMVWAVLDGPVFLAQESDRMFRFSLVLIVALTLVNLGGRIFRSVRPAPKQQIRA